MAGNQGNRYTFYCEDCGAPHKHRSSNKYPDKCKGCAIRASNKARRKKAKELKIWQILLGILGGTLAFIGLGYMVFCVVWSVLHDWEMPQFWFLAIIPFVIGVSLMEWLNSNA